MKLDSPRGCHGRRDGGGRGRGLIMPLEQLRLKPYG